MAKRDPAAKRYVVEKGIRLPGSGERYPFGDMEIGDSFKIDYDQLRRVRSAAHAYGAAHGKRFTVRQERSGTYRCWRIALEEEGNARESAPLGGDEAEIGGDAKRSAGGEG